MAVFYKGFGCQRTGFCLLLTLFLGVFVPVAAANEGVYTVSGVEVDVTADNAVQAREKAFAEAQAAAFEILVQRVLTAEELTYFTAPDESLVASLVQDFEVTNEQLSAVRYNGTYTFRFRPDAVRQMLSGGGYRYTDVAHAPVLVLPFYQSNGRTYMWEDNPWLAAWAQMKSRSALLPVNVPIGDLEDIGQLPGDDALRYDPYKLQDMTARYGAGEAVILLASPVNNRLRVDLYHTDNLQATFTKTLMIVPQDGQNIFDTAVQQVVGFLQQDWKTRTAVQPLAETRSFPVVVEFTSLQEWIETKKTLERLFGSADVKVGSLKSKRAELDLIYKGDENSLQQTLRQAGITLQVPQAVSQAQIPQNWWSNGALQASVPAQPYTLYLNKYR